MKRTLFVVATLLLVAFIGNLTSAAQPVSPAESVALKVSSETMTQINEAKRSGQVEMTIGLYVGSRPMIAVSTRKVFFDLVDIGKSFGEIRNSQTRRDLEQAYREMYEEIGTAENARRIASSVLAANEKAVKKAVENGKLPEDASAQAAILRSVVANQNTNVRKKAVDGFVANFERMAQASFSLSSASSAIRREPVLIDSQPVSDCTFLQPCPGKCGYTLPGGYPWLCDDTICFNCGDTPK